MFDVGFTELLLIFVIGLLILGPERLPRVAAQIGRWVARARRTANQLRMQLEREVALDEIRRSQRKPPPSGPKPGQPPGSSADAGTGGDADREAGPDDAVPGTERQPGAHSSAAAPSSDDSAAVRADADRDADRTSSGAGADAASSADAASRRGQSTAPAAGADGSAEKRAAESTTTLG